MDALELPPEHPAAAPTAPHSATRSATVAALLVIEIIVAPPGRCPSDRPKGEMVRYAESRRAAGLTRGSLPGDGRGGERLQFLDQRLDLRGLLRVGRQLEVFLRAVTAAAY